MYESDAGRTTRRTKKTSSRGQMLKALFGNPSSVSSGPMDLTLGGLANNPAYQTKPLPGGNSTNYGPNAGYHPSATPKPKKKAPSGGGQQDDPIQQALAQLYGLAQSAANTPAVSGYSKADIKQLMAGAGAAGAPMTAEIGAIRHQNQGARQEASKGQKQIQAMYRALAQSDAQMGASAAQTQKNIAAQINQMAATGNAQDQQEAQALMAENAKYGGGIASQLNTQIAKTTSDRQGANTQNATAAAAAALQQGGNNRQYFRANKSADLLEGANRSSDLISQLQSYIQGNRDKIAELAGNRTAAVASTKASLLSQITNQEQKAQESQYNAKQDLFKNLSSLLGTQIAESNTQADNARQDAALRLQQQVAANNANLSNAKLSESNYNDLVRLLSSNTSVKAMSTPDLIALIKSMQSK